MGKIYNFFPFGITRNTSHNFSKLSSGVFMSSAMQNPLRLSILNWMLANIVDMNSMHIIHVLGLQWTNSNLFIFIEFECLKFLFDTMIDVCIKLALYVIFSFLFSPQQYEEQQKRNADAGELTELVRDFLQPDEFYKSCLNIGVDFFCGVPDSLLKGNVSP